jgi:peptidoglycan hydrolase-like protein with peptidoglycan-binding domain
MNTKLLGAAALGLLLAGCGTDPQERTTGGAAAGAATGAGIGALGGPGGALAGAAIGAGAGAVTGAVTEPRDVNLGEPPWSNPEARVPGVTDNRRSSSARAPVSDPRTRELQQALNDRGYQAGPVDGIFGPQTRSAVREWQRSNNMEASGTPSSQMLSDLNIGSRSGMAGRSGDTTDGDRRTGTTGGSPTGSDAGGSGASQRNDESRPSQ